MILNYETLIPRALCTSFNTEYALSMVIRIYVELHYLFISELFLHYY